MRLIKAVEKLVKQEPAVTRGKRPVIKRERIKNQLTNPEVRSAANYYYAWEAPEPSGDEYLTPPSWKSRFAAMLGLEAANNSSVPALKSRPFG